MFVNPDVKRGKEISNRDVSVDKIYTDIFRGLLEKIHEGPDKIDQCMSLLFICRRLERVADHATHIGEDSVYRKTGNHVDLNENELLRIKKISLKIFRYLTDGKNEEIFKIF